MIERAGEAIENFRRKFWLWLYALAGRHVGPEVDAYWDHHWEIAVRRKFGELTESDLGLNFLRMFFKDNVPPPDREARSRPSGHALEGESLAASPRKTQNASGPRPTQ